MDLAVMSPLLESLHDMGKLQRELTAWLSWPRYEQFAGCDHSNETQRFRETFADPEISQI